MRALALTLGLAPVFGCGRIDFGQAVGTAGDGAEPQCSAAAEVCNGIDDNCDGEIDERCPCTPFDNAYPTSLGLVGFAWVGTGYLVAWEESSTRYVAKIDEIGAAGPLGLLASGAGFSAGGVNDFAWTGSELGAVWVRNTGQIAMSRFDASATSLGPAIDVSTSPESAQPSITWIGDSFIVSWTNESGGNQVVLREFARDGTPMTGELMVSGLLGYVQSISSSPMGYLVSVRTAASVSTAIIDRQGVLVRVSTLDTGSSFNMLRTVEGRGGGYASSWMNNSNLRVAPIDLDGTLVSPPLAVPPLNGRAISAASIAAASAGYTLGLVTTPGAVEIGGVALDLDGTIVGGPTLFYAAMTTSGHGTPSVAAASGRFAVAVTTIGPNELRVIQRCD